MASNEKIGDSYVNASGAWVTDHWVHGYYGWWYQFAEGGYAKNDLYLINGSYYFFDSYGYIVTGCYYFTSSGAAAAGYWVIDGKGYYFDEQTSILIS